MRAPRSLGGATPTRKRCCFLVSRANGRGSIVAPARQARRATVMAPFACGAATAFLGSPGTRRHFLSDPPLICTLSLPRLLGSWPRSQVNVNSSLRATGEPARVAREVTPPPCWSFSLCKCPTFFPRSGTALKDQLLTLRHSVKRTQAPFPAGIEWPVTAG